MKTGHRREMIVVVALSVLALGACADDGIVPIAEDAALLSIVPGGGSVDVAVGARVVVTFDHAIGLGMEDFAALHEGDIAGPEVAGTWTLSADRTVLTFVPAQALAPVTTYVVHLGGGMVDDHGNHVDLGRHGSTMGGQWASQSMMSGGMSQGGMGQGGAMGPGAGMMGQGWQHPSNGSYGMVFSFTTAG